MIVCMTWLLRIMAALPAPTSMALTCRWRRLWSSSFVHFALAIGVNSAKDWRAISY